MRKGFWVILMTMGCTSFSLGGEGYRETGTNAIVRHRNFGNSRTESFNPAPIPIRFNLNMARPGWNPYWESLEADDPEIQGLLWAAVAAWNLWEEIPTTRLEFQRVGFRRTREVAYPDGINTITLMGGTYGVGVGTEQARAGFYLDEGEDGRREIWDLDIKISTNAFAFDERDRRAIYVLAHEIGHGVGFNHSRMNPSYLSGLTGATNLHSVMGYTYDDGMLEIVDAGVLNPDDIALCSRLYPRYTNLLSLSTGCVRGVVTDTSGRNELYGAMVFLLDSENRGVLNRISGYVRSRLPGYRSGFFELNGVPPGTYNLFVVPVTEPRLGTIRPDICNVRWSDCGLTIGCTSMVDAVADFDTDFEPSWVQGVTIAAGHVVDVGYVLTGHNRRADSPSLVDATAEYQGSRSYSPYWFDFRSTLPREVVHRSGWVSRRDYHTRLSNQDHDVRIYGWNGRSSVILMNWTRVNYRARLLHLSWTRFPRDVTLTVARDDEASAARTVAIYPALYTLYVNYRSGGPMAYVNTVDGFVYRTYAIPSDYRYRVQSSWWPYDPFDVFWARDWTTRDTR